MMPVSTQENAIMALPVTSPSAMNAAFADAFNHRSIEDLLALYQPDAVLRIDDEGPDIIGQAAIAQALMQLLQVPGRMRSHNRFCIEHGELALLRADWDVTSDDGRLVVSGSSAEVVRRQGDGRWLYVVDHAVGAIVPRG
jgi:ketosteroid isomerase-like protein